MKDKKKVAIVTGSNKGIGYGIVKGLCQKFDGDVYLTSRDIKRGSLAIKELNLLGFNPKYHQLDITDASSIIRLKEFMEDVYGGIDVLVNNAAIAYPVVTDVPFPRQAEQSIFVNYFSFKNVCDILFPLLKPHARVVNLSSSAGHLTRIPGEELRKQLSSPELTEEQLDELMSQFVILSRTNAHEEVGWGSSAYAVSKVGLSALTIIQQKRFLNDDAVEDVVINCVHPGFVDTDMSSHKGPLTIDEGAEAPLYAALLPENISEPKGEYIWCNKEAIDWVNGPYPK